jgi:hypothetical protein
LILTVSKDKRGASITIICNCFGLKRDAFYKYHSRYKQRHLFENKIIEIVKKRRKSLPREGVRKLMKSLHQYFVKAKIHL